MSFIKKTPFLELIETPVGPLGTLVPQLSKLLNLVNHLFGPPNSLWSSAHVRRVRRFLWPGPTLTTALNCGFARGWLLRMMVCKRPVPLNDHLKEARPSRWLFARGSPIPMIICKMLAPPDDHLHLLFVIVCRCLSLFVVVCCLSLFVVVCHLLLFVICHLLFVVCHCLLFVFVCRLL